MKDSASFSQMVVVGSSAGGVEALSTLVHTLPPGLPAPVVVAQHLDPSRESHLGEILSRASTLPVRTLSEHEQLDPGVVYVVPSNRDVEITDHDIRLIAATHRSRPSIDRLFASAAEVFGEGLIAVVLTGTGSDGASGALDVQQGGGTVIIQDPVTASFPALPRSLPPSAVDFVVPLEEIGALLQGLLDGTQERSITDDDDALNALLRLLRERHGIDFRAYKPATILRRVQRRMAVIGLRSIAEYLRYAQQHPEEQQPLIAGFLIKVTKFFRDPDVFEAIRERVLSEVVEIARERDHTIRLWCAGCATGEEAYSLAILVAQHLGEELEQFHVRIFATDLDGDAITFARQGIYSPNSLKRVDPEILERYFDTVDGGYQISKRIRALMVFGQHDLGERAPFPRIDLVLCRNVLIYFTPDLQLRILQLFAFSLRDSGYLVLGKSETATPFAEAFVAENSKLKIYRRRGEQPVVPTTPMRDIPPPRSSRSEPTGSSRYGRAPSRQSTAPVRDQPSGPRADAVLFDLPVGVVVIDREYDIQYINDAARTLLGIHTSALGDDLIHQVQTVSPTDLRALIDRAMAGDSPAAGTLNGTDGSADATRYLDIVSTVGDDSSAAITVCVTEVTQRLEQHFRLQDESTRARQAQERAEQQTTRLGATNRDLLSTNQQLTREIAELRSQNEEYLVGSEQMQAATEEVETLNEELQATNEELETLNEELQATVEELNATNDDLQTRNLEIQDLALRLESSRARLQTMLNSLGDAIAVVDRDGRTILTDARYDQLFSGPMETIDVLDADGHPIPAAERPHRLGARGESFRVTIAVEASDEALRAYEVTGRPDPGDNEEGGGILVIRELSAGESRT